MATRKRIRAWRLGQEFNGGWFTLFEQPTVLRRSNGDIRLGPVGNSGNSEAMVVVGGCNFELNLGAGLHMNGRDRVLVLLGRDFRDLHALIECQHWPRMQKNIAGHNTITGKAGNRVREISFFIEFLIAPKSSGIYWKR
jgi:hypothetical protein